MKAESFIEDIINHYKIPKIYVDNEQIGKYFSAPKLSNKYSVEGRATGIDETLKRMPIVSDTKYSGNSSNLKVDYLRSFLDNVDYVLRMNYGIDNRKPPVEKGPIIIN